jgi:hypothetical protein
VDRKIEVTTLRTLAGDDEHCPDNNVCPSIHVLDHQPHRRYLVLKRVTDPAERAALAHLVGDDELVGWAPEELFPEV